MILFGDGSPLPIELLASKFFIPALRPNLVTRLRLVQLLDHEPNKKYKRTLVTAATGFGSTSLVFAWHKKIDHPISRQSLDGAYNGLPRSLSNLPTALQTMGDGIGAPLL